MPDQPRLIEEQTTEPAISAEEKAAYRERLRQKLQDPEFRAIEGFPLGTDEAILELSDPPYYTACPNPFLPEIIERWQEERRQIREELGLPDDDEYHREPFAADVSEGKAGYVYSAHSYHTKVPYKAVMRYILHYTEPGDIIYDGFCGTGMTGVAAQLCGDRSEVEALDYRVNGKGEILEGTEVVSQLGVRKVVLGDLSPIATFIAHNYNAPMDLQFFASEAQRILHELEEEYGWMYETWHPNSEAVNREKARIDYVVWSDVFVCPECSNEIVFVEEAFDSNSNKILRSFPCPSCGTDSTKGDLQLGYETYHDDLTDSTVRFPKRVPTSLHYSIGKQKYKKKLDSYDFQILERIARMPSPSGIPTNVLPDMQMMRVGRMKPSRITHLHHFFLPRARHALAFLWSKTREVPNSQARRFLFFAIEQAIWGMSLLNRYAPTHYSQVNRYLSGVFYIASQISEVTPWYILEGKISRLISAFSKLQTGRGNSLVMTTSATIPDSIPNSSVDYIFVDPPFGENIYYSDLNYLIESWHEVLTNSEPEAIIDRVKNKRLLDYQDIMREAFKQFFHALKPGKWMTVEFHNSQNSVWNAIQEAMLSAGFVVADVRVLDKKQGSFQQVNSRTSVKQDLVISAYKPTTGFEQHFIDIAGTKRGTWEFVREHLAQLPVVVTKAGTIEALSERQDFLLFDRMVAFHIQRGVPVPLSAAEFYAGLRERFVERDGMFFLPEQAPEYDRARLEAEAVGQLSLFVDDEKSAIQWLRQELSPEYGGGPQTYQEIQPKFLKQLHQARHEELPELSEMLEQNFLQDEQERWYVPDPNKASDLEKLRLKALLREFNEYAKGKKKLKQFRTEAVRAGFGQAWQDHDYETIVDVAERLPESVLQEDPELLMYYDNASLRV